MRISDWSSDVCSSDLRRRTAVDFAEQMRDLVDVGFPDADKIRVVMDNLSTHTPGALYEAFPAPEAHRLLSRLEFHFTPKHASWLNMAARSDDRRVGNACVSTYRFRLSLYHY